MSANIKASTDGTQAIIGVGGVDQMTVSNAGVVTANSFVGAISAGNISSSTAIATGSATARTLANRFADVVNVKDFGAVGDGVTDDTYAINLAFTYASNTKDCKIVFPSGNYKYNGIGHAWTGRYIYIEGSGVDATTITITSNSYLIDTFTEKYAINVNNITFIGGLGCYRSQSLTSEVHWPKVFSNCVFDGYTSCAISADASDSPNWIISDNIFRASSSSNTMGVALPSWCDCSIISGNTFWSNQVHIKVKKAGVRTYITNNMFFQSENSLLERVCVFLQLPSIYDDNAGKGTVISDNKFGVEFLSVNDYKIVYADEGVGQFNGNKFPILSTVSTNFAGGGIITNNEFDSNDINKKTCVFVTGNVGALSITNNIYSGSSPSGYLEYLQNPIADYGRQSTNVIYGNVSRGIGIEEAPFIPTKLSTNCGNLLDVSYNLAGEPYNIYPHTAGAASQTGLSMLYSSRNSSISVINGVNNGLIISATKTINDAWNVTLNQNGLVQVGLTMSNVIAYMPAWIEFDIKTDPSNVNKNLSIEMAYTGNYIVYTRILNLKNTWNRYRFPFQIPASSNQYYLNIKNINSSQILFDIGTIRIYNSREPAIFGASKFEQLNLELIPTSSSGLQSGSIWIDSSSGNVLKIVP